MHGYPALVRDVGGSLYVLAIGGGGTLIAAAVLAAVMGSTRREWPLFQLLVGFSLIVMALEIADHLGNWDDPEHCSDCGWGSVQKMLLLISNTLGLLLGTAFGTSIARQRRKAR